MSDEQYDKAKDFISLQAWQAARETKLYFYRNILPALDPPEKYNLGTQIRRAAISITANIAEGHGRFNYQESIQFCRISRGSLFELKDHLLSCHDLGYASDELFQKGLELIENTKRLLNGYIRFLHKEKRAKN